MLTFIEECPFLCYFAFCLLIFDFFAKYPGYHPGDLIQSLLFPAKHVIYAV